MDDDPGTIYLLETAKDRLARDSPGYRIQDVDSYLDGVLAAVRNGQPPASADVRAVTFPLTSEWSTGYTPRDVDRLLGELAQLVRGRVSSTDLPPAVRELVDQIRNCQFGTTRRGGYDEKEVDDYLDRIMDGLVRGERGTLTQLAGKAEFTAVRLRPGYVRADVDRLLASVERGLADLAW
ncbi:MAG: DivIVA domain-containing protein [Trebonia sp.]